MSFDTHVNYEEIYIPPPGLAFRILGYVSQKVLFSRTHLEPEVGHYPSSETFSDHWFTLLHGSGAHAGLYAIKSLHTGKVLFSRQSEPRVGHVDGNGQYEDNWFKLEPGKSQYVRQFRLITPSQGMALFSRTNLEPYVYNHTAKEIYADHHFSFLFEDMEIENVDYDLDHGRVMSSTPLVIADQTLTNRTTEKQAMSFTINKSITNTSTYEFNTGFTIKVGTTFQAGIPFIAEGKVSVEASTTQQWKWGETNSYTTSYDSSFPVTAGPGEVVHAISSVNQGQIDVPFTIHLKSKSKGVKVETKGMWHGVSAWDLRHTIELVKGGD